VLPPFLESASFTVFGRGEQPALSEVDLKGPRIFSASWNPFNTTVFPLPPDDPSPFLFRAPATIRTLLSHGALPFFPKLGSFVRATAHEAASRAPL